jgi:phage/plasmid-like protein (TIGR03299 family)
MSYAVKGAPFRYRGAVNVEECKTAADVMFAAGLDWEVAKCELVAKMPIHTDKPENGGFVFGSNNYVDCPNAYATYRTDYNIPLGIVKERYTPVQNIDAFTFFDGAIGKDKAIWQTAGFFGSGERIFVSAKLPKNILVDGDPVENYLVFTTSHDGSSGVKILFTPIRVVCQNTLNAAIATSSNFVSFRHTKFVHQKIDVAAEILGICDSQIQFLNEQYNFMKKIKMNDTKAQEIFANVILTEDEQFRVKQTGHTIGQIVTRDWRAIQDSQISMKKVNTIVEMNNYYFSGAGQREILGTAWGVYGAVTGYYANVDNSEGTKRMDSLLYGDKSRKIELAGNLLIAA